MQQENDFSSVFRTSRILHSCFVFAHEKKIEIVHNAHFAPHTEQELQDKVRRSLLRYYSPQ